MQKLVEEIQEEVKNKIPVKSINNIKYSNSFYIIYVYFDSKDDEELFNSEIIPLIKETCLDKNIDLTKKETTDLFGEKLTELHIKKQNLKNI